MQTVSVDSVSQSRESRGGSPSTVKTVMGKAFHKQQMRKRCMCGSIDQVKDESVKKRRGADSSRCHHPPNVAQRDFVAGAA
jgi:hypothetical protein